MAELDSLVGSRISLISQQDVRYEGVLFNINAEESSIILKDGNTLAFSGSIPCSMSLPTFICVV